MRVVKLENVCDFQKGETGLAKAEPGEYPLVTTGAERKTCNIFQFDTSAVCIPLVSSTGHGHASLKNVHYQEGKFALGSILVALTAKDDRELNIQFLHLYLSQLKDQILVPLMSGAANVALSVTKIKGVELPLPNIERQTEIVEQFKSIVYEENQLKDELTNQQALLRKLRAQILQEAVEGKLTAKWRANNPNVEPASELLKRIATEKAELVNAKKSRKQSPVPLISDDEKYFDIPNTWAWCRIGDIATVKGGKRLPKGHQLQGQKSDHPYLRVLNLTNSTVEGEIKYLSENTFLEIQRYTISKDDLYITIAGTVGRPGAIPEYYDGANLTENSSKITLYSKKQHHKYFVLNMLKSKYVQGQFSAKVYGMAMPKLALKRIETTVVPIPPILEQEEIVAKLEKYFALSDQLETQITHNQTHADALMQSVLREAFTQGSAETANA